VERVTVASDLGEILLVDDDCVDVMVVKRVLRELGVTNELVCAADGEEALAYLRGLESGTPRVILLDLNMPRMNGIEFLQAMKAEERFRRIPVVIVTTSEEQQDLTKSFELGVAGYVVKSSNYREFRQKMGMIEQYVVLAHPPMEPALALS